MEPVPSSSEAIAESIADMEDEMLDLLLIPTSEEQKQELADGIHHMQELLIRMQCIKEGVSAKISKRSMLIGRELVKRFMKMCGEMTFSEEEVLLTTTEADVCEPRGKKRPAQAIESSSTSSDDGEDTRDVVPYEVKLKAVKLSEEHPKWSLTTLQKHSTCLLKSRWQLSLWKKQVLQGGSRLDKLRTINNIVYERFDEARRSNVALVTTRTLKQWAMAAAFRLIDDDFQFCASDSWVHEFKKSHHISVRRVTKYVSHKDRASFDTLLETASIFQRQTADIIQNFSPDFVINTDQIGCEYKDEKMTHIAAGHVSKLTHSYTAQYAITYSGKLLPQVFMCLQDPTEKFGHRVEEDVKAYMKRYTNVYITFTKSGKLQRHTCEEFLDSVIKPYVRNEKFLYIIDSWIGQTSVCLHHTKFIDEQGHPTCTLAVIPPKCTPFCSPCDVYFYRQLNNYIRHIQNCPTLLQSNRKLTSREDVVKIHSIVHNQLQAPIYEKMLRYAWYASKLRADKEIFADVNEVAFPKNLKKEKCNCNEDAAVFVRCSWCRKYLCFGCFFDAHHPTTCTRTT